MSLLDFYSAQFVKRWHNKPYVPAQTTGQHTFGMLLLLRKLYPEASKALHVAIIDHDMGENEGIGCDLPHPLKQKHPHLKELDESFTTEWIEQNGLAKFPLTEDEKLWLKYLDQLEAVYYLASLYSSDDRINRMAKKGASLCHEMATELKRRGYLQEFQTETVN